MFTVGYHIKLVHLSDMEVTRQLVLLMFVIEELSAVTSKFAF